jgi:hypothetical protein
MGRTLAELLESYQDDGAELRPRRTPTAEMRAVLETALRLAAAVVPSSVVGIAYSPANSPISAAGTIVRLAGVGDIERSLTLGDRLADDGSRGLADVKAEHLILRSGDRLRLGVDRGWELDAEQRSLLEGIALLASRALARSGVVPLGSAPGPEPSTGPDPSSDLAIEVA